MNLWKYFLCFAVFSFIGWAYESVYYSIQQKKLINSGFLNTCFCPIYGVGALIDLLLLGWIENTFALFIAGIVVTCTLEYFVSWMLERIFRQRWWDYTGWPLNINGRVCLFGGMAFGLFTVMLIKYIAPFTMGMFDRMDTFAIQGLTAIIAFVMLVDTIVTARSIDASKLWYIQKQSEIFDFEEGRYSHIVKKIKDTLKR